MTEERMVYVAGFKSDITEDLLEELFTQTGPVVKVVIREVASAGTKFALVEFEDEDSVLYAIEVMDGVKLQGVPLQVKPRNGSKQEGEWRQKRSEIYERQRSTPSVDTHSYSRGDRGRNGDNSRDRGDRGDRDRRGNRQYRDDPPPPQRDAWRNDHYSTPQLPPHQQFIQHMMSLQQHSAPASFNQFHPQQFCHPPPPLPPQHNQYQTPRRHDRQGYDRRDSGRRQGGGGGGGRY